jgi:hypothetical protein
LSEDALNSLELLKAPLSLAFLKKHPTLKEYYPTARAYLTYLRDVEHIQVVIDGILEKDGDVVAVTMRWPYMHRWRPEYMAARLAKLYLLENWAKSKPSPLTMLTYTVYHDTDYAREQIGRGYTIEEAWAVLKQGFRKSSLLIRNRILPGSNYFWIVEPQMKSGYPHIHAGYFGELVDDDRDRLKRHWSENCLAGDYLHGLDFSTGKCHGIGDIASLRNYLMKYMGKTFLESLPSWTPEELVFNAMAWRDGWRLFGSSREISRAMRLPPGPAGLTWVRTYLEGGANCPVKVDIRETDKKDRISCYEALS